MHSELHDYSFDYSFCCSLKLRDPAAVFPPVLFSLVLSMISCVENDAEFCSLSVDCCSWHRVDCCSWHRNIQMVPAGARLCMQKACVDLIQVS